MQRRKREIKLRVADRVVVLLAVKALIMRLLFFRKPAPKDSILVFVGQGGGIVLLID